MTKKSKAGYIICTGESEYFAGMSSELYAEAICFAHIFPYTEDMSLIDRLSKTVKGSVKELEVSVKQTETFTGSTFTTVEYILA